MSANAYFNFLSAIGFGKRKADASPDGEAERPPSRRRVEENDAENASSYFNFFSAIGFGKRKAEASPDDWEAERTALRNDERTLHSDKNLDKHSRLTLIREDVVDAPSTFINC